MAVLNILTLLVFLHMPIQTAIDSEKIKNRSPAVLQLPRNEISGDKKYLYEIFLTEHEKETR